MTTRRSENFSDLRAEIKALREVAERLASALELACRLKILAESGEIPARKAVRSLKPELERHLPAIVAALYHIHGSRPFSVRGSWAAVQTLAQGELRAELAGVDARELGLALGHAAAETRRLGRMSATAAYGVRRGTMSHHSRRWTIAPAGEDVEC